MIRASIWSLFALAIVPVAIAQADDAKKSDGKHHMQATITKVDVQKDMVTVKMMDKDGKGAVENPPFCQGREILEQCRQRGEARLVQGRR